MSMKSKNSANEEKQQAGVPSNDQVEKLANGIVEKLKSGKGLEAMNLLAKGQAHHILTTTPDLPKRLVEIMGKKMVDKFIAVFVHFPCPFCKKGRSICKNCEGHGHTNLEMVCTDCLGLGLVKCDFCDGSGWSSIDAIPAGLRPLVLYQRTKIAKTRIKRILSKPIPRVAKYGPAIILKKCAQLLMDLNRYIGVLENTVVGKDELVKSHYWPQSRVEKMIASCIQSTNDAEKKAREVVRYMAETAQIQAKKSDNDSTTQKLAAARTDFYKSLLDSSNIFASTNLEHPFLDSEQ